MKNLLPAPAGMPGFEKANAFLKHYILLFPSDVALILGLVGICRIIVMMVPVWLGMIVDGLIDHQKNGHDVLHAIGWPFAAIIIIGFPLRGLLYRWMMTIKLYYEGKLVTRLRSDLFDYVRQHSLSYFQNQQAGALAAKIQLMADTAKSFIFMIALDVFRPILSFIIALTVMFHISDLLGWTLVLWLAVFLSLCIRLAFSVRQLAKNDAEAKSIVGGYLTDALANIASIIAFSRNRQEADYADQVFEQARDAQITKDKRGMLVDYMQETGNVVLAVTLMFCLLYGFYTGHVTAGSFAIVIPLAMNVAESTRALVTRIVAVFESYGVIQNGIDTLLIPPAIMSEPNAVDLSITTGDVTYEKISFAYRNDHTVLTGLDLRVANGEKIGLVGPSGAGKSTLLSLLLRFHDVQQGRIIIDGQDITHVTLESLRQNIALIPQDTYLFHRSVADNIRYGRPDATQAEIEQAARQAFAHDFILHLPGGYETIVGERGAHLSGGQRQRITIARAILKNAPILILDEATSALDSESEEAVQAALDTIMQGKTVIAIAHRLSTLLKMDRLVVLENGRIIEEGTHAALLEKNGLYARLWAMQISV